MRGRRKNVLPFNLLKVFSIVLLVVMLATSFAGCSDDSDKDELEKQVSELQKQVEQLKVTPTPSPTRTTTPSPTPKPTPSPTPTDQPKSNMLLMVSINGGSFNMGDNSSDSEDDERPVHRVSVDSFVMAKYEVTYGNWYVVRDWAKANGYRFDNEGDVGNDDYGTNDHPVTMINWYDAVKWCNALSEMENRTPCYYTNSSGSVYRTGNIDIKDSWVKWDANGYRLPTEAEWEYACRANTTTKYSFGDSINSRNANYDNEGTVAVGRYSPNSWGLYDMHGNVWEWCWDWYDEAYYKEYYKDSPFNNPHGPSVGSNRVHRGGSWHDCTVYLRSAFRGRFEPDIEFYDYGFRPVRSS